MTETWGPDNPESASNGFITRPGLCQAGGMTKTPARVRPFRPGDREQVLALAPRLAEGVASCRDPEGVANAVKGEGEVGGG